MPGPLGNLGKMLEKMTPEAREMVRQVLLREVMANLKGVALAIQAPRSGLGASNVDADRDHGREGYQCGNSPAGAKRHRPEPPCDREDACVGS